MCLHRTASLAWDIPGGFAEYTAVPAASVLPLDDRVPLDVGVLLLDYLGTTCHGLRLAKVDGARSAAVIGCGPIGLGAIVGLKLFGVPTIFGADLAPYRLQEVQRLGASAVDARVGAAGERILDQVWPGVDLVVEASGTPAAWHEGFTALRPLGTLLVLGEHQGHIELDLHSEFWHKDCFLVRSWYFPKKEFVENQALLLESDVDPYALISHSFHLDQLQEAMELFCARETTKVIITCS
jgi:propanol-preferring alcohol dehydrogenase